MRTGVVEFVNCHLNKFPMEITNQTYNTLCFVSIRISNRECKEKHKLINMVEHSKRFKFQYIATILFIILCTLHILYNC